MQNSGINPYSIGVGVFVRQGNKILVGQRGPKCNRGAGCLALPGGHVEPGETIIQAAIREVLEETELAVDAAGGVEENPLFASNPFRVPGCLAVTDHLDPHQQVDGNTFPHLSLWIMTVYRGTKDPFPVERVHGKCDWWQWMKPSEVLTWKGCDDPTHPQYYWTPAPLWRKILRPWFGDI